ncbi:AMP-binding protein [Paenibacillus sp. strain BS8-2]
MFFERIYPTDQTIIITNEKHYSGSELLAMIEKYSFVSEQKELVLLLCDNNVQTVAAYLAALRSGHSVMLMSISTNKELLDSIVAVYQPKWIVGELSFADYRIQDNRHERVSHASIAIHSDLAILLSTSGTTGSQKFVRLSYSNIQTNAEAIVDYLQIGADERAILNLPLSYSYGLSILNSHLQAGASVLLTEESVVSKTFWSFVEQQRATSLPGVPFTYQMLNRAGFSKMELPHLKTLTQAGGRLDNRLVQLFGQYAQEHNKRFYVMYGQTEAAPRMSYIPADKVLEKSGSIGIAIPGGQLTIAPETNELIYKGPNVMMGYAESVSDLAKGDECHGILYTGDTAEVDQDGYYTITGRMKRFVKLFGLRINLDDVERKLEDAIHMSVACVGNDDKLVVVVDNEASIEVVKDTLESTYKLHKSAYKVVTIEEIPTMANGKIDYKVLKDAML